ncbi:MAG: nitrite reductase large subunit NirB [candidate division NC10 bacterium]|nr:nitrite reductase large subunit NirB [candidate division NC10 bacterium]MDE2322869.1 nitrite reductase large subunit NirB [candidate division NC10 bacterium]
MDGRTRLVVIGNGMAGTKVVQEILSRDRERFHVVMFGSEPYGNYDRTLLSDVLTGSKDAKQIFLNSLDWYRDHNITLHAGMPATAIDRDNKIVRGGGIEESYDTLIIATGSRALVPPVKALEKIGVFVFRTLDDCQTIEAYARGCRRAAVMGGGLLGLEAARGLLSLGLQVTVVEMMPWLMAQQLDAEGGALLQRSMEQMGVQTLLGKTVTRALGGKRLTGLEFQDGTTLDTDMVVMSCGIRPNAELAERFGLAVDRGIVVNDRMQTSDPDIYAVGECAQHRGKLYGLVAPLYDQARVLAEHLTGVLSNGGYQGSRSITKLKVMGIQLVSMGDTIPSDPQDEVVSYVEPSRGVYKKMIIRNNRLAGATLLGETDTAGVLTQMFLLNAELPDRRADLLFGTSTGAPILSVFDLPDHAQICHCHGVTKGQIKEAIEFGKCRSVSQIGASTRAGTSCGGCKKLLEQFLEVYAGEVALDPAEHWYVPSLPMTRPELVAAIKAKGIKSVSALFRELNGGREEPSHKAALASLLKTIWAGEYEDERDARFINDRVHANIQKDGTFSVVPRIYGGVTSPAELRRIADVAERYQVPAIKLTGGQRIALAGVRKEQLPHVWKDLGMASGHAYTKAVRSCKTCVGSLFCRFGLGDSIALGIKIEKRFHGIETPHKMKLAAVGCPRNCAESTVKDLGAVAIEGGWQVYVGGGAGTRVRAADLLCTVKTHEEVLTYMGRFIQYYREHGKYMERAYGLVERVGIDELRELLVKDVEGIGARLDAEIERAVEARTDPWAEADAPVYPAQFGGPVLVELKR